MRRKLYADQDVSILSARRVVIVNGIDVTIRRADFARRISDFELQPITKFKSDSEVAAEWAAAHPIALGALLDLTVSVMKRLPGIVLGGDEESLTMTMFARIAKTISEPALKTYMTRLGSAAADMVDSDPFAGKLTKFAIAQQGGTWTGLASDLLAAIPAPDPVPRSWPKDAARLGVWVRRFGRVMESAVGIRITKEERSSEGQPYTVEVISDSAREITVGKSATPATQHHGGAPASENGVPVGVAGEPAQLHESLRPDQQECSYVADVATLPASQDEDSTEETSAGNARNGAGRVPPRSSDGRDGTSDGGLERGGARENALRHQLTELDLCEQCGERHNRYGPGGRPCRTLAIPPGRTA